MRTCHTSTRLFAAFGLRRGGVRARRGGRRRASGQLAYAKLRDGEATGGSDDGGRPSLAMTAGKKLLCDEVKRVGKSAYHTTEVCTGMTVSTIANL